VRERVPAISGNEGQTALLFFPRKGTHLEHGVSTDDCLSSHRLKAGGYPERISDDPGNETVYVMVSSLE